MEQATEMVTFELLRDESALVKSGHSTFWVLTALGWSLSSHVVKLIALRKALSSALWLEHYTSID